MKIDKDINGKILNHGDKVLTIKLNGRAKGGDLVYGYYKQPDENKVGMIVESMDRNYPSYDFYKTNFNKKVMKID